MVTSEEVKLKLRGTRYVALYYRVFTNLLADRLDHELSPEDFVASATSLIRDLREGNEKDPLSVYFEGADERVYNALFKQLPTLAKRVMPPEMVGATLRRLDKELTLFVLSTEGIEADDVSEAQLSTLNVAINGWYLSAPPS
ncbi:MAG: hypothetical protein PHC70_02180 [Patescibacteria group bacterium]|nr:hypothetical protein [Patescibacteria group bacterium]